jgi:hypothetical protein
LANSTARGRPTYPSPIMAIFRSFEGTLIRIKISGKINNIGGPKI